MNPSTPSKRTVRSRLARILPPVLLLLLSSTAAQALTSEFRILLNVDVNPTTGCDVTTADGVFPGVEQILVTTVETGASTGQVTLVERRECVDEGTDTFGPLIPVSAGGWPVGVGLGLDGSDVVETFVSVSDIGGADPPPVIRLGVVGDNGGRTEDALLVVQPAGGQPILLTLATILEIPTLSEWGLILLALLLATLALWQMRRMRRRSAVVLLLLVSMGVTVVAWASVRDGLIDDWFGLSPLAQDPQADAPLGADLRAFFAQATNGEICFRLDSFLQFNQPPTITDVANQSIVEDGTTGPLAFTVGDAESPATSLTVTATSSNQMLVPDGNLTLGGSGANRTIEVTPEPNQNGMTDVILTVEDPDGGTASTTFKVTVTSDNDPPTISAIGDQTILEDGTTGPLAFTVDDVETAPGSLTVTGSSSNTTIIPNANLAFGGSGSNRTITVTPAANQNGGPVTITVTVQDGDGGSVAEQFGVTVTPVNDPPSFSLAGNVTSDEDGGPQTVPNQATAISPGPNEAGQTVSFTVTNDNNALFSTQPAIDSAGTLTYESAAEASGSATVTVTAMDDGGTANGGSDTSAAQTFTITVNAVDDPATVADDFFRTVGNTLLEVSASQVEPPPSIFVMGSVLANDSDPDNALTVAGTAGVTAGAVVTMNADGTFTYVPPPGLHGDGNPATGDDSFQYQLTGGELGTVQIDIDGFVWYVDNTANGGTVNTGTGTSVDRFSTLADGAGNADTTDDADDASAALGDTVYVFFGDGSSTNQEETFSVNNGQQLLGEGVDLVVDINGTPTTLFTGNPARKPLVRNDTTVAVTAINASGTIAGLDIASTGTNAVNLTVGGGSTGHAWVVRDNAINGSAAANAGIDVGHAGTGTTTLEVLRNTVVGGTAVDVESTAGNLHVALDQNTGIRSTSGAAPAAVSMVANGGEVVVTSLNGNQVLGTTATAGMVFDGVVFDTAPGDGNFTGDEVAGGNTSVGSAVDPVPGSALVMTDVSGDIGFGILDLFTNGMGSVGLDVTGNGTLNAGAGTGFEITNTGGTINSVNGPAVDLDPLTAGLTFSSVSSGSSGVHGIRLHDAAGSFTATGGTLANSVGSAIRVTGTNPGDSTVAVSLSNMTVNHTAGLTPVIFGQNSNGLFSLTGSTVNKGGGRVLDFDDMDGGSDFTGTTINSTNHHGKRIIDSSGVHNLPNLQIATAPPAGVDALHLVNNPGATFNVPRLEVTTNGSRGIFANNGGTLNVTGATNQITTTGHSAVEMSNTTVGTNGVTFASLSATSTGANEGIDLDGVGGGTFNVTGTTTVNGTGAGQSALDVATSGATFTFNSIDVDNPGGAGVALTNNTGPVTISGGDVSGSTGNAFDVDQGAANVTYNGTLNNGAARLVEVTNRTGGTVGFGGALVDNGATNSGILLDNNDSGTVQFTSTVDVTGTSGAGVTYQNSGGGTTSFADLDVDNSGTNQIALFATNNTGGGTLNVTTGTAHGGTNSAVDIDNTVLGVTLFSATSIGGSPVGIDLASTTGSFTVTGDGATGGAGLFADNNGSGGAITGKTGNGVRLADVTNVSLNYMTVNSNLGSGIHGTNVNGFVLTRTNLVGNGDAVDESGLRFGLPDGSQNGLVGSGLAGPNPTRISHVDISAASEHNVEIINTSGTLTNLVVENSRFRDTNTSGLGADGFQMELRSSAVGAVNVSGSTFSANATQGFQGQAIDTSSLEVNVTGSTFTNNNEGLVLSTSGSGDLTFDISNNGGFTNHDGVAIFVGTTSSATATSNVTGSITNNTNIQTPSTGVNHSVIVFPSGDSKAVVLVDGNTITNDGFFRGINVTNTDNAGDLTDLDITVTNNTVTNGANADHAILVEGRRDASVCAKIEGNAATAVSATKFGIRLRERDSSTVQLEQGGSASSDPATVLGDNNPASAGFSITGAPAVVANNTCDQVP